MNMMEIRRKALLGSQKKENDGLIYKIRNRSLATEALDTGILLLQEGKTGWCIYLDIDYTNTAASANTTSTVVAFYRTYWHWCRDGEAVGCDGRMTSDNEWVGSGNAPTIKTFLINADFENMKLDVILNNGDIVKPTKTIPNRVNSTKTAQFWRAPEMTINELLIWNRPLTTSEIEALLNSKKGADV